MGNRAVVIFTHKEHYSPCIYLHWNGGPESVYGFLEELERRGAVRFGDVSYAAARFVQVAGEFFDIDGHGALSLGVWNGPEPGSPDKADTFLDIDPGDNGVYLVGWKKCKFYVRRFICGKEFTREEVNDERKEAENHDYGMLREQFEIIKKRRVVDKAISV